MLRSLVSATSAAKAAFEDSVRPSALHDLALEFHRTNNDFFVCKYEDFIAGRYAAVENYLGIALPGGDADVTAQYEHVVRPRRRTIGKTGSRRMMWQSFSHVFHPS